jgi:hypothetical protein
MTYTEILCEPDTAGLILGTMRAELFAPPLFPADCFPAFP